MTHSSRPDFDGSEIAVVGMAGRFPGAPNVDAFWRNLCQGVESISTFADEELLASGEPAHLIANENYVKSRGVLEDVDAFDASFFGFSPREAEILDPQQRVFLECAWEALEHAGYDSDRFDAPISLCAGAGFSHYLVHNLYENPPVRLAFGEFEAAVCNMQDSLATRVAYKLNLKGPCFTVQTFCSTSLVAIHLACQNLLNYESDMALAGGVTIYVPQRSGYLYQPGGILSPDGHCRPFDADAQGTVFGNAVGLVVLRRFEDALGDRDTIHAVVRGSAINNDGSLKVSYAAPGVVGQATVITEALAAAGIKSRSLGYLETHGTGTLLGDPAEVAAMTKAIGGGTADKGFCAIGSVKGNVGHLDAAAGVTGFIKTVLALKHGQIPPSLNFELPNPEIDFGNSPFYVNRRLAEWKAGNNPCRAGVSSFGIGGTNAHVILEEAPARDAAPESGNPQLIVLSARTAAALDRAADNLAVFVKKHPDVDLADVAYTLQVGRRAHNHRRFAVCANTADVAAGLRRRNGSPVFRHYQDKQGQKAVLVFSDCKSLRAGAIKELYDAVPDFRGKLDECCNHMVSRYGLNLRSKLLSEDAPNGRSPIEAFAIHCSIAGMWIALGVRPASMIGAELVCASVSGVLELGPALDLLMVEPDGRARSEFAKTLELRPPTIPFISGATGEPITNEQATDPRYWAEDLRHGDGFTAGLRRLAQDENCVFLQCGVDKRSADTLKNIVDDAVRILPSEAYREESGDSYACMLQGLGKLWLAGVELDWSAFWKDHQPYRIPLPAYPFERQRYWVSPLRQTGAAVVKRPEIKEWLYVPIWKSSARAVTTQMNQQELHRDCWMVFEDDGGVGARCAEVIQELGHTVIRVRAGDRFAAYGDHRYSINPRATDDYQALMAVIDKSSLQPRKIAHMWSVNPRGEREEAAEPEGNGCVDFYSVLHLVQALVRRNAAHTIELSVVSTGVHEIGGDEALDPRKAITLALCNCIPQEHANINCRHIDIDRAESSFENLPAELLGAAGDLNVAIRRGRRWVRAYERLSMDEIGKGARVREGATYLITGGLGGLGYVFATHLARTSGVKLVLTGRTPIPDRTQWDAWLKDKGEGNGVSRRIAKIRQLESLGAAVMADHADVRRPEEIRRLLAEVGRRFGPIRGVIHAAGVLDADTFRPVMDLDMATCERQFGPKIDGLYVLERELRAQPLEFWMLTSSLSTVLGGLGYCAYAAANTFLDAFASAQNQGGGVPWITVNWDQWRFDEAGDGLANKSDLAKLAILPDEGAAVFDRLLRLDDPRRIIVSTAPLATRLARYISPARQRGTQTGGASVVYHQRPPDLEANYEAPKTEAECALAEIWQNALGVDRVGVDDNFFDLGGHSMLTVQVISTIENNMGVRVKVEEFIFQALGQMAATCEQRKTGERA